MSDLSRLLESSEDQDALSLLRAAHEQPPEGSMGRVAAALGVGVGGALVSGASATALLSSKAHAASSLLGASKVGAEVAVSSTPWLASVIAKPLAIGLLGGLAAVSGVNYVSSSPARSSEQRQVPSSVTRAPVARPAHTGTPRRAAPPVAVELSEAPTPKVEPQQRASAPASQARRHAVAAAPHEVVAPPATATVEAPTETSEAPPVAKQAAPPPRDEALVRELALLGRARSQLVAGNAAGALRVLDEYSAERRSGALEPEAVTLRIQALERVGDRASAARLARSFIKAHPERAHDDSLRSIASEAP